MSDCPHTFDYRRGVIETCPCCNERNGSLAATTGSGAHDRAEAIIKDMLVNHLPRIVEWLNAGYVDENQILVLYDHAVRARILKEHASEQPNNDFSDPAD